MIAPDATVPGCADHVAMAGVATSVAVLEMAAGGATNVPTADVAAIETDALTVAAWACHDEAAALADTVTEATTTAAAQTHVETAALEAIDWFATRDRGRYRLFASVGRRRRKMTDIA